MEVKPSAQWNSFLRSSLRGRRTTWAGVGIGAGIGEGPGFTSTEKVCLLVKEVPTEGPVQVTCDETVVHFVVRRDGEGRISVGGWQSLGPRARKRRPHHSANQAGNLWLERWLPEPDAWNLVCLKCFYFFAFSPKGLTPVKLLLEKHSTKPGGCG